jgi:cephalosporin-C deacetylase
MNWSRLIHRGQLNRDRQSAGPQAYPPPGPPLDAQCQAQELYSRGDLDGALALHQEAAQLCRDLENKHGLAFSLGSQALILQNRGALDRSAALHHQAQQLYQELGNHEGVAISIRNRAQMIKDAADFDGAMALYEEAEGLYRELDHRAGLASSLRSQVTILEERRDVGGMLELISLVLFDYLSECRQLHCVPMNRTGIYGLKETAGWTVVRTPGTAGAARVYTYQIKKNNLDIIQSGTLDFASGDATIEASLDEPAMLYVTVGAEGFTPASRIRLGAAIAPTDLKPSVPRPPDFDAFWDAKLRELEEIPLHPVTAPLAAPPGVELSTVRVDAWSSHVHGYLARPANPGKFPALVIFQYAGVYALKPHTAIRRAAEGWLIFDVCAHDLPPETGTGVSPNYEAIGNTSRETSYFLKMYLRDARAVDCITSRPDWDGKTLVLMGTCMGGQQALVISALRPQVSAVIVNQPSGADSNGELHGRKPGYPYWPSGDPKVMATALYFDPVNFAPRIHASVLASMGFIDTTSPPAGIWTVLNQIPGRKEVITMIELDHTSRTPDRQGAFRSRASAVLDILLHGDQFQPNS